MEESAAPAAWRPSHEETSIGMSTSSGADPDLPTAVDAVVIGAGHNGLVAAITLADAGWDVVLVEATGEPGGAVRTAELTAPGFRSDVFSAFYPLGMGSPVISGLGLAEFGLRWRHAPLVLAHVLSDGRAAVLSRDVEQTAESVDAFASGDGDAWRAMVAQWNEIGDGVLAALFRPFPPIRPATRLARQVGTAELLRLARLAVQPVRRAAEERFSGEGAALLLAGNALHTDLTPEAAGSAIFGWLLAMLGSTVGYPVPEGGAGALIAAMTARLRAAGGQLICNAPVASVQLAGSRATGVRLVDGRTIQARRAVLADVPAPALYRDLVGEQHLPARLRADLDAFQWDAGTVKIDWALSRPVPWTAAVAREAGTVHLGADLNGLTRYAADLNQARLPTEPFLLFGQMTTADPSRSPAGTESAWAYTHVPRGGIRTEQELAEHVERMEETVERHAPGFGASILARHVMGPADLQTKNPSLVDGAINGGTSALHQQLIFRPVPGLGRAETVVPGLFLASSSAHPGGGVHGGPGHNAALAALHDGPVRRATLRALHRRIYA
jgi:phytoene dehydrogenase-like protein